MNRIWIGLGWAIGCLLALCGILGMVTGEFFAILVVLSGAVLLPPVWRGVRMVLGTPAKGWMAVVVSLAFLLSAQLVEDLTRDEAAQSRSGQSSGLTAETRRKAAERRKNLFSPEPQQKELLRIPAKELYDRYEQNELAADDDFKNKRFIVTGEIQEIREDWGAPSVILYAGLGDTVMCRCEKDQRGRLAQMRSGDTVILEGVCQGLTLNFVTFQDCNVVN